MGELVRNFVAMNTETNIPGGSNRAKHALDIERGKNEESTRMVTRPTSRRS